MLVAWTYFLLQDFLMIKIGTPYYLSAIATPSLSSYGLAQIDSSVLYRMFNPSWIWIYAAPGVLFVTNLALSFWVGRPSAESASAG